MSIYHEHKSDAICNGIDERMTRGHSRIVRIAVDSALQRHVPSMYKYILWTYNDVINGKVHSKASGLLFPNPTEANNCLRTDFVGVGNVLVSRKHDMVTIAPCIMTTPPEAASTTKDVPEEGLSFRCGYATYNFKKKVVSGSTDGGAQDHHSTSGLRDSSGWLSIPRPPGLEVSKVYGHQEFRKPTFHVGQREKICSREDADGLSHYSSQQSRAREEGMKAKGIARPKMWPTKVDELSSQPTWAALAGSVIVAFHAPN